MPPLGALRLQELSELLGCHDRRRVPLCPPTHPQRWKCVHGLVVNPNPLERFVGSHTEPQLIGQDGFVGVQPHERAQLVPRLQRQDGTLVGDGFVQSPQHLHDGNQTARASDVSMSTPHAAFLRWGVAYILQERELFVEQYRLHKIAPLEVAL